MNEKIKNDAKHWQRFGEALGTAIEAGEIVADAAVGTLDKMCFRLCKGVGLGYLHSCKGEAIATVFIGIDVSDVGPQSLY